MSDKLESAGSGFRRMSDGEASAKSTDFGKASNVFHMNSGSMRADRQERRSSLIRGSDLGLLRQKSVLPVNTVNPFVGSWQGVEGIYNTVKTILLFPLAMLRLFLCIMLACICSGWCYIALIGVKAPEDIGYVRRYFVINPAVRACCRMFLFVLGFYWIPIKGRRDSSARVMIANHTTMIDVVVLLFAVAPSFLSKSTVLGVPLIGTICSAMQVIGVDRTNQKDKEKTKMQMKDHVALPLAPPLLVFPEGTTCRYDTVLRFKPGAFDFGLPVQPVLLHWRWNFTDPSSCATTSLKSWALQMLSQFYHYVEVEYLPVLKPDDTEKHNPLFFTTNARKVVLQGLQRRAAKRTCTPGFSHEVYEVLQGVDDFLIWKRLLSANMSNLSVTLQTFSLESVRDAIELASPVLASRKRIDLSFALAASERYARIWHCSTIPGHNHKSLVCYEDLTQCTIGDRAGSKARQVFVAAFLEAAVFPCFSADAIDFRQFVTALIWLSNLSTVWGEPMKVFMDAPMDGGVVKWASVRSKIAFSYLCSSQVMKDDVTRADAIEMLGENEAAKLWDDVFKPDVNIADENKDKDTETETDWKTKRYNVDEFKDALVHALCSPVSADFDEESREGRAKSAAYELIEKCFGKLDSRFRTGYYEGGSFFLTEKETNKIHDKVVPLAREKSVEEKVVEDPSENV